MLDLSVCYTVSISSTLGVMVPLIAAGKECWGPPCSPSPPSSPAAPLWIKSYKQASWAVFEFLWWRRSHVKSAKIERRISGWRPYSTLMKFYFSIIRPIEQRWETTVYQVSFFSSLCDLCAVSASCTAVNITVSSPDPPDLCCIPATSTDFVDVIILCI